MTALLLIIFRMMIFLSVALLVIGIFKPEWFRFRQKQPSRIAIVAVAIGICMIGAGAMYYAGNNNAEAVSRGKKLGEVVYAVDNNTLRCDPGTKPGTAGASNDEQTSAGIRYMVKTPANYNASIAHSLLMVYAPARTNRYESEEFMDLTQEATAAGFIVAYADHRKMSTEAIVELAEIPGRSNRNGVSTKNGFFSPVIPMAGPLPWASRLSMAPNIFQRLLLPVRWASGVRI